MVIDAHQHLYAKGVKEHLARTSKLCEELGIDKICLFSPDHAMVELAAKEHPDLVIPFVYLRPGVDDHTQIEALHAKGFRGIKLIRPAANYDDERFFPIYEKAQELKMPVLLHTGVLGRRAGWDNPPKPEDVSSARMHPLLLDHIARAFPRLALIAAHLGVPSFNEAGMTTKWNYNLYVDLSGAMPNRVKLLGRERTFQIFTDALWWEGALDKVVFGSDWPAEDLPWAMQCYTDFLQWAGASDKTIQSVMGGTMAKLLGIQ